MQRKLFGLGLWLCFATNLFSQSSNWTGKWAGVLNADEMRLALMFRIDVKYSGWYTKLNIPQQGLRDYVVSSTKIDKKSLRFELEDLDAVFEGKRTDSNTVKGYFYQHGKKYPLQLKRVWGVWPKAKPQAPKPPFPYLSENFKIPVANGRVMLAGTITKPDSIGVFPAIILVSGSGPQDRNGSIGDHQPFLLLSDIFTRMGFAVLRFDDRGAGETRGHPDILKNTTTEDIAADVSQLVDLLKSRSDIKGNAIGILGHSEGGIIAPMVAAKRQDIAFVITLAGPAAGGLEANILQNSWGLKNAGLNQKNIDAYLNIHRQLLHIALTEADTVRAHRRMDSAVQQWSKKAPKKAKWVLYRDKKKNMENVYTGYETFQIPWWHFFMSYQPATDLKKIHCPLLALNGSKDVQVSCEPNLSVFRQSISDSTLLQTQCIPGLNHLFQECKTCTINEYFQLDETFSPKAISIIETWLNNLNLVSETK